MFTISSNSHCNRTQWNSKMRDIVTDVTTRNRLPEHPMWRKDAVGTPNAMRSRMNSVERLEIGTTEVRNTDRSKPVLSPSSVKVIRSSGSVRKKEERFVQALKKIEPTESSELFFLKMDLKCKNYVPIGRKGIYHSVILKMHLHWKKHHTLKVVLKTFSLEEVKEIAAELACLTRGVMLDIHEGNTVIMYRGKNCSQPPIEIMSSRVTLTRKKALDKSKYRHGLRAVRRYIPRLEQDLMLLKAQAEGKAESGSYSIKKTLKSEDDGTKSKCKYSILHRIKRNHLYLDEYEKFPIEGNGEAEDFEQQLCQLSLHSKVAESSGKDVNSDSTTLDEVDRMYLRAASLLKRQKRWEMHKVAIPIILVESLFSCSFICLVFRHNENKLSTFDFISKYNSFNFHNRIIKFCILFMQEMHTIIAKIKSTTNVKPNEHDIHDDPS
ncbi:hypothetical protein P3X46_017994 [Hevea brasiliensis]|uniref:CRM domain-containing protein n=1 Tax=Hevea brasiliensis TaxID=3981 RepID=A0ABQ9LQN3_HEVBR|nr:hypothetical protein P3X46_017994 [Hevea brasiliensis]